MLSKFKLIIIIAINLIFFSELNSVYAQTITPSVSPEQASKTSELQKQINEYQSKISELQGQAKTLSSQIQVMDNQIELTTLKIESSKQQITDITLDIDIADNKVEKLDNSLSGITEILINRIRATYIAGSANNFQNLLSSNNISDLVVRANYLKIAQQSDKRLIYDTVQAKNDYSNQKNLLEGKKLKIQSLQKDLEGYTTQLASEKREKDTLLELTKNDEAIYQDRLEKALAEQRAIAGITSGSGNDISQGPVNEGDTIGSMISGASTCSSGTHLHFEVKNGGNRDNPSNYLSNKSVTWNNSPDGQFSFGGSWAWPLSDPVSINQGYGITAWSNVYYGGGLHTGIDMSSTSTRSVKAVKGGTLYKGGIACGGGQLLYSRIEHNDGTQSYYLHVN